MLKSTVKLIEKNYDTPPNRIDNPTRNRKEVKCNTEEILRKIKNRTLNLIEKFTRNLYDKKPNNK